VVERLWPKIYLGLASSGAGEHHGVHTVEDGLARELPDGGQGGEAEVDRDRVLEALGEAGELLVSPDVAHQVGSVHARSGFETVPIHPTTGYWP
jgi:hypothetical protein